MQPFSIFQWDFKLLWMLFQEAGQDMTDFRSSSPPIPTIANKQTAQGENEVYDLIYAGVSPCCRYKGWPCCARACWPLVSAKQPKASLLLRRFVFRKVEASDWWWAARDHGKSTDGRLARCLLPAFLCAGERDVWVRGRPKAEQSKLWSDMWRHS